jgi:ubiquitin thioesterase protein OTUB1
MRHTDRCCQGPLVGERQSSAAITTQYANADPVYRIKTAALPAKYAYFRTCRGDGHCGWRGELSMQLVASKLLPLTRPAIAFTYFEALLRLGDGQRFADEEGRLTSMANLLDNIGYHRDIWIDFADEAYELLRKLGSSVDAMDGTGPDILLQAFNDQSTSMSIITYFKVSSNYRRFID